MIFPTIFRRTSPTPMGLVPGFLSRGINRDATYAAIKLGCYAFVANFMASNAIYSLRAAAEKFFEQRIIL